MANLSVESLKKTGGFTGGAVKREVVWEIDGEEFNAGVYIRPMSYHTATSDVAAMSGGGDVIAGRLSRCVCDEDGAPVFQVSDITGLDSDGMPIAVDGKEQGPLNASLASALMVLVGEVSGLGKTKPNPRSRKRKTSGTS